jgi:protein SCO1/2
MGAGVLSMSVTLLGSLAVGQVGAGEPREHHPDKGSSHADLSPVATEVKVPDVSLIDQEGRAVGVVSDVIGEKIVVMNFIYTSCKTACPMSSAIFGLVQERLGSRLGTDVRLVSLTVDPVTDSPARLKAFARKMEAREGWQWLTGEKPAVDRVLEGLGVPTPDVADHPTVVLVGDGRTGRWMRLFGFPSPDEILAQVERLQHFRDSIAGEPGMAAREKQSRMPVHERGEQ